MSSSKPVPLYEIDFSKPEEANLPGDPVYHLPGSGSNDIKASDMIKLAPDGKFNALRIDQRLSYVDLPGIDICPSNMPDCTLVISAYLVSKPIGSNGKKSWGWILNSDNGGFDRSIFLTDERFNGIGLGVGYYVGATFWENEKEPDTEEWFQISAVFRRGKPCYVYYNDEKAPNDKKEIVESHKHELDALKCLRIGTQASAEEAQTNQDHYADAWIKGVKVFDRALDDNEIRDLNKDFQDEIKPTPPTPLEPESKTAEPNSPTPPGPKDPDSKPESEPKPEPKDPEPEPEPKDPEPKNPEPEPKNPESEELPRKMVPFIAKSFLAVLCRSAFVVLALCTSIFWTHTDDQSDAPGIYNSSYFDGMGGFWLVASILFITSIVLEMNIVSAKMTRTYGGFILNLIGAMNLFISSIMFFVVPRNDLPEAYTEGFILVAGLITFIAQIIIALQYRVSGLQDPRMFIIASVVGAFGSIMFFAGGLVWVVDFIINGDMSSEPESYDIEHVKDVNNRLSICLIIGCGCFMLNAIALARAFCGLYDELTELVEDEESHIPA